MKEELLEPASVNLSLWEVVVQGSNPLTSAIYSSDKSYERFASRAAALSSYWDIVI